MLSFEALPPRLAQGRVAVLGDAMLDRYVSGAVERISPEAPVPVLLVNEERAVLGGAANVAANIVSLGGKARLICVIGDDPRAHELTSLVDRQLGPDQQLVTESKRQTTLKTRFVAGQQQLLRVDRETARPIISLTETRLLAALSDALPETGAVVLADYGKGALTPAVVTEAIARARAAGRPVIVDPKGRDFTRYRGADIITPNRKELREATGLPVGSDAEVEEAARAVIAGAGIGAVIATRSEQGLSVVTADGPPVHLPTRALEVFDVSGAGDTVVAVLALALAAGIDLVTAATLGNAAAGVVVARAGTATVSTADLQESLRTQARHGPGHGDKVVSREEAAADAARWREQGLNVGFSNGCFDLLHPGHVSALSQARAACDRLIVGLNADASVRRLKGPTRPVNDEQARAAVLAALADVDRVVIFEEDTPLELIRAVRPTVLVKGADYKKEQVVGAADVESWGGRVVLAALEPGFSTTSTIAKMGGQG